MTLRGLCGVGVLAGFVLVGFGDGIGGLQHGFRAEPQMRVGAAVVVMVAGFAVGVLVGMFLRRGDAHDVTDVHDGLLALVELCLFGPAVISGAVEHHDVGLGELGHVGRRGFVIVRFH